MISAGWSICLGLMLATDASVKSKVEPPPITSQTVPAGQSEPSSRALPGQLRQPRIDYRRPQKGDRIAAHSRIGGEAVTRLPESKMNMPHTRRDGEARSVLPLTPKGASQPTSRGRRPTTAKRVILTVISGLSIVLGLFLLITLPLRGSNSLAGRLPDGVVEVLGRARFVARQQLVLVRLCNKLILLCVKPNGTETIAEVTDANEVRRIEALCHQDPRRMEADVSQILNG